MYDVSLALFCIPLKTYHGILALVDIPVETGELGLSPFTIGTCVMAFGIGNGSLQVTFMTRAFELLMKGGYVFCSSALAFFPIIVAFPVVSLVGPSIWAFILVQATLVGSGQHVLWFAYPLLVIGELGHLDEGFAEQACQTTNRLQG